MYYQFLIEDKSSEELVTAVMEKIVTSSDADIVYNCKSFHGIGKLPSKIKTSMQKTGSLLNDLPGYLRGFSRSLQGMPAVIIVVLDNDDRDPIAFKNELQAEASRALVSLDHVFCIAVEELEAWLLGDEQAVIAAYPHANLQSLRAYKQDSICGTWETLANVVYPGGVAKLKKDCSSYYEIGAIKIEWAQKIGSNLTIDANKSPSFNSFIHEIYSRI